MAWAIAVLLGLSWVVGAYALGYWMGHHKRPFLFWRPVARPTPAMASVDAGKEFVLSAQAIEAAEQRLGNQAVAFKHLSPERRAAVVRRLGEQARQLFGKGA